MSPKGILVGEVVDWLLSSASGVLDETSGSAGRCGG